SIISLPEQLKDIWKGCGGTNGTNSALKLGVRLDLLNGQLNGPLLEHGKCSDKGSLINKDIPEPGGLRIGDLGFFSIDKFKEIDDNKSFFMSRWHVQTNLYTTEHEKIDMVALLKDKTVFEMDVLLSAKKLPVRLIAIKVPENEIKKRQDKIQEESRKSCRAVNSLREQLIDFNIYLTNVPDTLLTLKEIIVLMKARWQIELLFKLWKNECKIDEWRTAKPFRILSEVYAKLIAMVIQHWLLLISCWSDFERSLTKAVKIIQKNISILVCDFSKNDFDNIEQTLEYISNLFQGGIKINKRSAKQTTAQLLNDPESLNYFLG
ncbi:MAG: IS4 family transposase, partial [Alphaproteobacteria bacterium]